MESFDISQEDVCGFQAKIRVLILGDFNARVGKVDDVDDVNGLCGESTCNSNGNLLINLLHHFNL